MSLILNPYSAGGVITLTLVGEVDTANSTITMPGSIAAGDLCFAGQYAGIDTAPTFGNPSGFTQVVDLPASGGIDAGMRAWYKILVGSETTVASGLSGGDEVTTFCVVWRPSRAISAVNFGTWGKELTNSNPAAQAPNPTALPAAVVTIGMAGANGGSFSSFGTFTPSADNFYDRDTGFLQAWLGYRIDNVTPQSSTIDMQDEGTMNALVSGYLAVS
jgi:hypothetical protein